MIKLNSYVFIIVIIMLFLFVFIAIEIAKQKKLKLNNKFNRAEICESLNMLDDDLSDRENNKTTKKGTLKPSDVLKLDEPVPESTKSIRVEVPQVINNRNKQPMLHADQILELDFYENDQTHLLLGQNNDKIFEASTTPILETGRTLLFEPADLTFYAINNVNPQNIINGGIITADDFEHPDNIAFDAMLEFENANLALMLNHNEWDNIDNPNNRINNTRNNAIDNRFGQGAQNVHDTEVNRSVRNIMDKVELKAYNPAEINSTLKEIARYWKSKNPDKDWNKSITCEVLEDVAKRNSAITNLKDFKEMEILTSIWKEANAHEESTATNIKDMLLTQIDDSHEVHGLSSSTVCPTGFTNRIATALVVETPEAHPKTQKMYEEEFLNVAAHIRNKLEQSEEYNDLSDIDQLAEFKRVYYDRLNDDYKGLLDDESIKKYTKWIDDL